MAVEFAQKALVSYVRPTFIAVDEITQNLPVAT
jgi:hypothetical protein